MEITRGMKRGRRKRWTRLERKRKEERHKGWKWVGHANFGNLQQGMKGKIWSGFESQKGERLTVREGDGVCRGRSGGQMRREVVRDGL